MQRLARSLVNTASANGVSRTLTAASAPAWSSACASSSSTVYHCDICGKDTELPAVNKSTEEYIAMEAAHSAHNYHPIPTVFVKGSGSCVWDPEGKHYFDYLSAYSAVNSGHGCKEIRDAMVDQLDKVSLSSRAFHNNVFPEWAKFMTELFGYKYVLPMNTGAEGVESALKLARLWAHHEKGVPRGEAITVACTENFHGRTLGIISMSDDEDARAGFEPFLPNIRLAEYGSIESLEAIFNEVGDKVSCFLIEPIQGEAGVKMPPPGYLKAAYDLCKKHNVLFIADEVQSGIARTGKMLAHDWEGFKADVVILGKAISGGMYPVSCILADEPMMLFKPGMHGSTYGGNPLAAAVSKAALSHVVDNDLAGHSLKMGEIFRSELEKRIGGLPFVKEIRGKGLLNAVVVEPFDGKEALDVCLLMMHHGLLAKPTHRDIIRFAPPLVITEAQMAVGLDIIEKAFREAETIDINDIPGRDEH